MECKSLAFTLHRKASPRAEGSDTLTPSPSPMKGGRGEFDSLLP